MITKGGTGVSPFFWDKFWDFVVTLLGVILGGGAIVAWIEWQRHRRERQIWETERRRVAIDVVSADISVKTWRYSDDLPDNEQLQILKHQLDRTVESYRVLLKLVIRNTTNTELVITGLETEEPGVLPRRADLKPRDTYRIYDLESVEYLGRAIDPITLGPYGTLGRIVFIDRCHFDERQRLETAPSIIETKVRTSDGYEVARSIPLKEVPEIEALYTLEGELHFAAWQKKAVEESIEPGAQAPASEEEIPF